MQFTAYQGHNIIHVKKNFNVTQRLSVHCVAPQIYNTIVSFLFLFTSNFLIWQLNKIQLKTENDRALSGCDIRYLVQFRPEPEPELDSK